MSVSQKAYERVKDQLSSLKLTLDALSNPKLMEEIRRGIDQRQKGKWTRVRDDIKMVQFKRTPCENDEYDLSLR